MLMWILICTAHSLQAQQSCMALAPRAGWCAAAWSSCGNMYRKIESVLGPPTHIQDGDTVATALAASPAGRVAVEGD